LNLYRAKSSEGYSFTDLLSPKGRYASVEINAQAHKTRDYISTKPPFSQSHPKQLFGKTEGEFDRQQCWTLTTTKAPRVSQQNPTKSLGIA